MYSKVVIFLCAAGIASSGNLLHAAPLAYGSPVATYAAAAPVLTKTLSPAVSYQSISTHGAPAYASYAAPGYASYAAPGYASYAAPGYASYAAPALSAYGAPAYSTYAAGPVVAKTIAAPALSYSSVAHSSPLTYATGHVSPLTYANAHASHLTYGAGPYSSVAHAAPLSYAASPVYTKTVAPVATYASYGAAPVVKSAVTYSAAPAVSHVTYNGLGASYGW